MINLKLLSCMLIATSGVQAQCLVDSPEIGDIGPASERVCTYLEQRFPTSALQVRSREIRSPRYVSLLVSVDGKPDRIEYELSGMNWSVTQKIGAN
jgi:hypothetical protein